MKYKDLQLALLLEELQASTKKLEEAQEALGIDPHDYVPVTYVSEMIWYQELLRFAPTALVLGTLWYMGRGMQGGFGIGGSGGKGGRGIFNIGKAKVTKLDKNSKNKYPPGPGTALSCLSVCPISHGIAFVATPGLNLL
ncbi:ATP-dependent zinc metalloprotease FTSH 3, mitochondrial [Asimina triloba]